jgi:hypothetical protein
MVANALTPNQLWDFAASVKAKMFIRSAARLPQVYQSVDALVSYPKGRTVFRPRLATIIEPCRRNIRVSQPFLNLGDVGLMRERVRRRCRAQ